MSPSLFSSTPLFFFSREEILQRKWGWDKGLGNWPYSLVLMEVEGGWDVVIKGHAF